jgi:hypothetical protein
MKKRYQVFVSSTYLDLKEERQAVFDALRRLDCIPAGMEFFPASDSDPLSFIKQVIDECDYYIVIMAGKYGTVFREDGISYTEREYDYARGKNIPTLAFLHESPESIGHDRRESDDDRLTKLNAFRKRLQSFQPGYWKTAAKLKEEVLVGIPNLINDHPRLGLVRADSDFEKDQAELTALRQENDQLKAENVNLKSRFEASIAGGEDIVQIEYSMVMTKYDSTGRIMTQGTVKKSLHVTWNELYTLLSPSLQTWVSQHGFAKAVNTYIGDRVRPSLLQRLEKRSRIDNIYIAAEHFDTIVVQFQALGLIDVIDRDGQRCYVLTEKGKAMMLALRSIKKECEEDI